MIFLKNKHQQSFEDSGDVGQLVRAAFRPFLDTACESMMNQCYLNGGNIAAAKKLTIEAFLQRFDIPANTMYKGQENLRSWAIETVDLLCDAYSEQWRQMVAQLRGEEEFTAEVIRVILATLPDRNHGIAWLYIFQAVGLEATFQVFRMPDDVLQKVLADVKCFFRRFFFRLVDSANFAEPDAAIRLALRKILSEAIQSDIRFRVETKEMLKNIFAWVAVGNRSDAEKESKLIKV